MKEPLLYLCHRIPYPPNKGDKITTYNVLKFLNQHYDVYLGCFIDAAEDEQYRDKVNELCKESFFVGLNPTHAKIKGLTALGRGEPITLPYYRNRQLSQWVDNTLANNSISKAFVYSGCMAQYVLTPHTNDLHKIMQFADIDSDKWRQYANASTGIMKGLYEREAKTLADYEKHVAEAFSISCFISDTEVDLFKQTVSDEIQPKIKTLSNGIDSEFFSPQASIALGEDYALEDQNYIVFTGAMDYRPNIETVRWFTENIWPDVLDQCPNCKFYIVGSSPSKQVLELQEEQGVIVTGRVEDVRPYLANAKAAVAPMQMARGIQNKILEAMAMELPVLTSHLGVEGIDNYPEQDLYVTDSQPRMIEWVVSKLNNPRCIAKDSRQWLKQNFSWDAQLSPLLNYLGAKCD